jgi:hypothetical protein
MDLLCRFRSCHFLRRMFAGESGQVTIRAGRLGTDGRSGTDGVAQMADRCFSVPSAAGGAHLFQLYTPLFQPCTGQLRIW